QIPAIDIESAMTPAYNGALVPVMQTSTALTFTVDTAGTPADNNLELATMVQNAMFLRPAGSANLNYVANGLVDANDDALTLQNTGSAYAAAVTYPNSTLSTNLKLAARYIIYGLQTQAYYMQTGGFDNHSNEVAAGNTATG